MKRLVFALAAAAALAGSASAGGYGFSLGYSLFNTTGASLAGPSVSAYWTPVIVDVGGFGVGARVNAEVAYFTNGGGTFNSSVSLGPILAVPLGPILAYVNPAVGISYFPTTNSQTVSTFYVTLGGTAGLEFALTPYFGLYTEATYETLFAATALRFKFGVSLYE